MEKEYVYGFFANNGNGTELLWHLGVFKTHEEASEFYMKEKMFSDVWIDQIEVRTFV